MGSIEIIQALSIELSSATNKFLQYQEKNSWERWESNPGLLGEKQVCYIFAMPPLPVFLAHSVNNIAHLQWSFIKDFWKFLSLYCCSEGLIV